MRKNWKIPVNARWPYLVAAVLLVFCGAARILATYPVFTQTGDEGGHLACGMEWWDEGRYTREWQHPPLARIAVAFGPYLSGVHSKGIRDFGYEGNAILNSSGAYWTNLTLARLGVLPFYFLTCFVVWAWAEIAFGIRTALLATLFVTNLPAILANSSLATTDMVVTATLCASLLAFVLWLERPSARNTVLLGLTIGLAILSKFSVVLFLPVCAGIIVAVRKFAMGAPPAASLRRRLTSIAGALLITVFLLWAGYRFSAAPFYEKGTPHAIGERFLAKHITLRDAVFAVLETPLPGMQVIRGIADVGLHNSVGHPAYLLGEWSRNGWWYFFPVLLTVKTPLGFLILSILGTVLLLRLLPDKGSLLRIAPALFASAIVAAVLPFRINIGLRHVLIVYPLLCIVAAHAAALMLRPDKSTLLRITAGGLIVWFIFSSGVSHPDYLAYFNELVGGGPERIALGSDLDWGQDLNRLAMRLRERGIRDVAISYKGGADLSKAGLPRFRVLGAYERARGWVAVSVFHLELPAGVESFAAESGAMAYALPAAFEGTILGGQGGPFSWLKEHEPIERVGSSILLYYIP